MTLLTDYALIAAALLTSNLPASLDIGQTARTAAAVLLAPLASASSPKAPKPALSPLPAPRDQKPPQSQKAPSARL